MNTTHDLEIILDEHLPPEQQRVLKATVECDWSMDRNPYDKEARMYSGEDDGPHLEDWSLVGECEIDGVFYPSCPPDMYALIEQRVTHLSPDDL